MKRTWILALAIAIFAPIGLIGCGDEAKDKTTTESKGPGGTSTTTNETKTKTTGDGGPAAGGETAK